MSETRNKITILGCGSSSGLPAVEFGWGCANPEESKNIRTRSSVLFSINDFHILIDTSPDLRAQALQNNIRKVNALLYTHEHTDHLVGADELRSFNRLQNSYIDCYLNKTTYERLKGTFPFALTISPEKIKQFGFYCLALNFHLLQSGMNSFKLNRGQIQVDSLEHNHGQMTNPVVGYKINNRYGYITDIRSFYNFNQAVDFYSNLDVLIISSCVTSETHRSHISFHEVLELIKNNLKPKKAFLTHLSEQIDYGACTAEIANQGLSRQVSLCYDGLVIEI